MNMLLRIQETYLAQLWNRVLWSRDLWASSVIKKAGYNLDIMRQSALIG